MITPQLQETGLVAILRAESAAGFVETTRSLASCGVTCIEFTLTSAGAIQALREASTVLPDAVALGAGTVLDADAAEAALDAGASFLVSPTVCPDVIDVGARRGAATYPGALTPTEVLTAWRSGAAAVKVFPAALGGPAYIRDLRAPLPDIPLIPTGGVTPETAAGYLTAGAVAVGIGSALTAQDDQVVTDMLHTLGAARFSSRADTGSEGTAK